MATAATTVNAGAAVGAATATPAIRLDGVEKVYRTDRIETVALSNVNLEVGEGELVAIMGPSGCGKSTLLNLMGLLDAPSKGRVSFGGREIGALSDKERSRHRNREIGFVFQTFHLIPELCVLDNVEIPLLYRRSSASERKTLALAALDRVGLASRVHHYPSQLSGGQQQRVAIARAIVGRPRILLADEPTGNLDSQMGDEIMGLIEGLNRDDRSTVVMVTHDGRLAERAHRTIRLFDGRQVQ
ncbi:MAG TPA: ABC transporter ATP-binding protein [Vicinamibacteria bacterium]|nr:ABC transporter ATP-binding protein [Vicinamibacteria bacterium]